MLYWRLIAFLLTNLIMLHNRSGISDMKRCSRRVSPSTQIMWWPVVLDAAQLIRGGTNKAAQAWSDPFWDLTHIRFVNVFEVLIAAGPGWFIDSNLDDYQPRRGSTWKAVRLSETWHVMLKKCGMAVLIRFKWAWTIIRPSHSAASRTFPFALPKSRSGT